MINAPTLESVVERLQRSFYGKRLKIELDERRTLMKTGDQLSYLRAGDLFERVALENKVKLVGLLFMHPESELAKTDILPRIGQYHESAGEFTDFFFVGYGAYWPQNDYPDQREAVKLDGTQWLFSDRAFNRFRREIEEKTSWKYSGETDLILATARYSTTHKRAFIDYSQCITCCLEQIVRDEAAVSIPAFFEKIFHFGEKNKDATAYHFSDLHLVSTSKTSLFEWILSRVGLKDYYKKNKNLAIRDIAK
jgi:hypothetical protein